MRFGIPYRLIGGTRFYQRREVKDIIAYLRLAHNPHDIVSLRRIINVPQRGIGQRTMDDLVKWANEKGSAVYDALGSLAGQGLDGSFSSRGSKHLKDFYTMMKGLVDKNKELSASEMMELVIERTGYQAYVLGDEDGEDRWENIQELATVAREYDHVGVRKA